MKSTKDIEHALKHADLDVEVHAQSDRAELAKLAAMHGATTGPSTTRLRVPRLSTLKVAAVVALAVLTALLALRLEPPESIPTPAGHRIVSTVELATAISLEKAFRKGGIEAVENQYREAYGTSRRDSEKTSIKDFIAEMETEIQNSGGERI